MFFTILGDGNDSDNGTLNMHRICQKQCRTIALLSGFFLRSLLNLNLNFVLHTL